MKITIDHKEIISDVGSLSFTELTCLIKFLDEYINDLKYQQVYEQKSLSNNQLKKMSRKIKEAEHIKEKLNDMWRSHVRIE